MKALEKLLHFFRGDGLHRHALRQAFGKRMVGDHMALMSGGIIPTESFQGRNRLLQQLRRFAVGCARRQMVPLGFQLVHLRPNLVFPGEQCRMADDHADPSPGQFFSQHPGAGMVFLAFNPLADPHVMIHGHQQHVLARQNHVPGQERAFLALGVFFHLHQHVLPRQKRRGAVDLMKALLFPNGQKAVLGKAQLHECRLDLRQHPFHPAQKQRAHQTFASGFLLRVFQQTVFA